jgi:hypothetical protein
MSLHKLTDKECSRLVNCLQGTSYDIQAALDDCFPQRQLDFADLDPEVLDYIDNQIFWCFECGCWYGLANQGAVSMGENDMCIQCE